jgi:hypothetical protein
MRRGEGERPIGHIAELNWADFPCLCITELSSRSSALRARISFWGFYLYAIKKDGTDLCAIKKIARTCMPST